MSRTHTLFCGALLLGAGTAMVACNTDHSIVVPKTADPIFKSYVALGNSLTAGYQSGGINDSTQAQSYAVLLARAMGTRFAYPALAKPGCPPPINNFLAQTRVTLKGAAPGFEGEERPDRWALSPELTELGRRWGIEPERDLVPA